MEVDLRQIVVMALAVGTVSMTITKANIFAWLRDWMDRLADHHSFMEWFADLFQCPYCMSHWIALGLMLIYQPLLLDTGNKWPDLVVSWFALVALGALSAGAIYRIFKTAAPTSD